MQNAKINLGFQSKPSLLGGFNLKSTSHFEFDIAEEINASSVEKMLHDCQIFQDIIRNNPAEVLDVMKKCTNGEIKQASEICCKIGMTEASFENKQGGAIWLLVGIAALLYAQRAH